MKNDSLNKMICIVLTVLMSFSIVALFLSAEAGLGLFRRSNVMVAIVESDYEQEAFEEFQTYYEDLLVANGFKIEDAGEAFSENRFKSDLGTSIKKSIAGKPVKVKISKQINLLEDNLTVALINKGYLIDSKTEKAVESIANEVGNYYKSFTQFGFGKYYYKAKKITANRLNIILPITFSVFIISILGLYVFKRYKHRFYEYLRYGCVGAMITNAYIFLRIMFGQREFLNQGGYYYELMQRLYEFSIPPFVITELFLLLVWGLLFRMRKNGKN